MIALIVGLLARLPFWVLYGLSDFLYFVVYRLAKYRVKVVRQNLENSFGHLSEPVRLKMEQDFYRNLCDVLVETIKANQITVKELEERKFLQNPKILVDIAAVNGMCIVCSTHHCNWEWMIMRWDLTLPEKVLKAVYKPQTNLAVDELLKKQRSRFGAEMVPQSQVMRTMVASKGQAAILGLVADQTPAIELSYKTMFLGQPTLFYFGPEKLARSLKAPMMVHKSIRLGRGKYLSRLEVIAIPPYDHLPLGELTERYVRKSEEYILQQPGSWLWSHKRWKHQVNWTKEDAEKWVQFEKPMPRPAQAADAAK